MEHVPHQTKKRRIEANEKQAEKSEASAKALEQLAVNKQPTQEQSRAWVSSAPELLAVGLSIVDDEYEAASLVGLDIDRALIPELAQIARTKHKALLERKPAAVGAIIHHALTLAVIRLRCAMSSLPATQAAAAAKSLAQCLELVQGGTAPAYTELNIIIPGPDGPINLTKK